MNLSPDIQAFLDKDSTIQFLHAARQFIAVIEAENISKEQFYAKSHAALIDLYAAAHKLEHIELKYSSADTDLSVPRGERSANRNNIAFLGTDCFYWEVFDPTYIETEEGQPAPGWNITHKEPSQGWLVDDYSDIYNDLKREIEKMKLGTDEAIEDALWQLRWGFLHHWGNHCINAMRYLHYLWYEGRLNSQ